MQNNLRRVSQKYLYDEVQHNQIRASHILEYSWTLYIDIFAVKMEISLKKRICFTWMGRLWYPSNSKPAFAEKKTYKNVLILDCFSAAWK